ncbi:MAG: hypothetical protein WAW96_19990 [Alphaproteobacteria bacterium]
MAELARELAGDAAREEMEFDIPDELFAQGCVFIIDLFSIRVSSGVLWDRTRENISLRLTSILQRLAPQATQSFTGQSLTRCIVTLPETAPEKGIAICVRAAYELVMSLLGRCEVSDIHVSRAARSANGGLSPRRLQIEELLLIVERLKLSDLIIPKQLASKRPKAEGTEGVAEAAAALEGNKQRNFKVTVGFEPVWDARAEAVCMYRCAPHGLALEGGSDQSLADLGELSRKERASIEFNAFLLGIEQLSKCVERDDRFLLNVPISFETLASPLMRTELSQICHGILPAYRQYLIFTITDVPIGVTASRLSDFVTIMRPFGRVIATASSGVKNFAAYQNIGLSGIAIEMSKLPEDPGRVRSDILHVAQAGRNFKLGALLYGVEDIEIINFANAADVRLFHGPAIGEALLAPRRMSRLERKDVLPEAQNAGDEEWF